MAIAILFRATIMQVPDGAGGAALGQSQGNVPGFAAAAGPGAVGNGQSLELFDMEQVPGGDSPSAANFTTAFTAAATALGTKLSTAGSTGFSTGTPLALIQAWATGGP